MRAVSAGRRHQDVNAGYGSGAAFTADSRCGVTRLENADERSAVQRTRDLAPAAGVGRPYLRRHYRLTAAARKNLHEDRSSAR